MAAPEERRRLVGRRLLADTSVTLYCRVAVLEQTAVASRHAGYHVVQCDASQWLSVKDTHGDLSRVLGFPGHYGANPDAFNDMGDADDECGDHGRHTAWPLPLAASLPRYCMGDARHYPV